MVIVIEQSGMLEFNDTTQQDKERVGVVSRDTTRPEVYPCNERLGKQGKSVLEAVTLYISSSSTGFCSVARSLY